MPAIDGCCMAWGGACRPRRDAGRKEMLMYLTGRVDNLSRVVLVLPPDQLAERIFYSRIVAVDKVAIDKLHSERGLSCTVCKSWYLSHALGRARLKPKHAQTQLTNGPAAHNGNLSLLWCGRHVVAGFLRRS